MQGERIDIVPWSPDPAKYVYNALAPAEVAMVVVDDERKFLQVVVPDDQLSLAIGRQGQNVRLASRLLGWKIDVKSETRYANMENGSYRALTAVDGVDESLADRLFAAGVTSPAMLASMNTEELMSLARLDQAKAQQLQQAAAPMASEGSGVQGSEPVAPEPVNEMPVAGSEAGDHDGEAAAPVEDSGEKAPGETQP